MERRKCNPCCRRDRSMIRRVRESLGSETRVALRGAREGDTELMTKKRVLLQAGA